MNPQIQELLSKANLVCRTDGTVSVFGETYAGQAEVEKFAELIVRKCAEVMVNDSLLSDVKSAARGCARSIKQHFGVEE